MENGQRKNTENQANKQSTVICAAIINKKQKSVRISINSGSVLTRTNTKNEKENKVLHSTVFLITNNSQFVQL